MALRDQLDLDRAFRRVQQDKRDDAWPDVVRYRDYAMEREENLADLASRLESAASYRATSPLGIDLPKRGFTLRPGVVPLVDDRIAYQAIADSLAPHFEAEECVYSNRLSSDERSRRMFVRGVQLWLEFQHRVAELCSRYPYVVETDITAYFEHVRHDLLSSRIDDLFADVVDGELLQEAKSLLRKLWFRWTGGVSRFGIPQMNDASSFFANLYLDELDKWMLRNGYEYVRYVDDIRVFAEDEPSARRALAELIVQLRPMNLYVASAKTAIKECEAVLALMGQANERISAIEVELNSGVPDRLESAVPLVEQFFVEAMGDGEFSDRHFRYCINRFKRLKVSGLGRDIHGRVVSEVLARLESMPYSADIFVDYLSLFPDSEEVQVRVLEFLEGPYNVYPWQQMTLLELLIRCDLSTGLRGRALDLARVASRPDRHPACRAKALSLWGKYGDYADRREIRQMYDRESRNDVRRAIVVAIQEMRAQERDHFYNSVVSGSTLPARTARYVQSLTEPTYHYYYPPPRYEIAELYEDSDDLDDLGDEHILY